MLRVRAWQLVAPAPLETEPLRLVELPDPVAGPGQIVVELSTCGLCRTDIHICEGEIDLPQLPIVPGHQGVGRVVELGEGARRFPLGTRVGIAWLHESCGLCEPCERGAENLCRAAIFSGYHRLGCLAERVVIGEDFAYSLPERMDDIRVAPLLCAGIIGYRALRQADVSQGERVGLYGFGSSAHIALQVATARGNEVFVVTRGELHRALAQHMGASWVGGAGEGPPVPLDRAVIFAPAGSLILDALEAVRWGGTVTSACIHMSPIPEMDYSRYLFGERTLRSTTASTRQDGRELMEVAATGVIATHVEEFGFEHVNEGLLAIKQDRIEGSAVVRIRS